jgi:hypothetical protein
MIKKIEQLEELQKNHEFMGHCDPICPLAARKPAAAAAHSALRPQVNFVSS